MSTKITECPECEGAGYGLPNDRTGGTTVCNECWGHGTINEAHYNPPRAASQLTVVDTTALEKVLNHNRERSKGVDYESFECRQAARMGPVTWDQWKKKNRIHK